MPISEFALIERYFSRNACKNKSTRLGIGDDCALLSIAEGYELAVTTDTMVENVHFFPGQEPAALGYKLLAVNLSDLAAMGAEPVAVTLALTLPQADEIWLSAFAQGFFQLAEQFSVDLIGGDTSSGSLTLTVQAMGQVPVGKAMLRSGAKPGEGVYLTGTLGDAALGLKKAQGLYQSRFDNAGRRWYYPQPRVDVGCRIREFASACIDISDGLLLDLGHILDKSRVGACLDWGSLPFSLPVEDYIQRSEDWMMPLTGGEDYELCFTVPPKYWRQLESVAEQLDCTCRRIGIIERQPGLRINKHGKCLELAVQGYEHFAS